MGAGDWCAGHSASVLAPYESIHYPPLFVRCPHCRRSLFGSAGVIRGEPHAQGLVLLCGSCGKGFVMLGKWDRRAKGIMKGLTILSFHPRLVAALLDDHGKEIARKEVGWPRFIVLRWRPSRDRP